MKIENSPDNCGHPVYLICQHKPCAALDLIFNQITTNDPLSPMMAEFLEKMVLQAGESPCSSEIEQVQMCWKMAVDQDGNARREPVNEFERTLKEKYPDLWEAYTKHKTGKW